MFTIMINKRKTKIYSDLRKKMLVYHYLTDVISKDPPL